MSQQYNTVVNALEQFSANHLSLKRFKCSFFEQMDNFSTSEIHSQFYMQYQMIYRLSIILM